MLAHRGAAACGLAGAERLDDGQMHRCDAPYPHVRDQQVGGGHEGARLNQQGIPGLREDRVSRRIDDDAVELDVGGDHARHLAACGAGLHLDDGVLQIGDAVLEPPRGQPPRGLLKRRPHRIDLDQFPRIDLAHPRALVGQDLDEAHGHQIAQRLADRRLADAQVARDLRFHEPVAGRVATANYRVQQGLLDLL